MRVMRLQTHLPTGWLALFVVGMLAGALRGAVLVIAISGLGPGGDLTTDPDSYRLIAETLAQADTFGIPREDGSVDPTAFRPPLYPWLLSWFVRAGQLKPTVVAIVHTLLGALTCVLVFSITARLQSWPLRQGTADAGRWRPWLASLLVALDPLLLQQSTLVMTETLATCLAALVWWSLIRVWGCDRGGTEKEKDTFPRYGSWLAGSAFAIAYLCRPVFIVWWGLCCLALGWRWWATRGVDRRWVRQRLIGCLIPVLLVVACWTVRNQRVLGKAYWATSHGGYTLLLGNNPSFYAYLGNTSIGAAGFWGEPWDDQAFQQEWQARQQAAIVMRANRGDGDLEVSLDAAASAWAKATIAQQPTMFLRACWVRIERLWSPIPRIGRTVGAVSLGLGCYYSLLLACCVWSLLSRLASWASHPLWIGGLLLLALTLVHTVYWSNVRMRAPATPVIVIAACLCSGWNRKAGSLSRESE